RKWLITSCSLADTDPHPHQCTFPCENASGLRTGRCSCDCPQHRSLYRMHGAVSTMGYFEMAKTAIKTVMSRPATLMYPARPGKMTTLSRWHVVIDVTRCISCGMCMKKCPAEALCVDKEAKTWTIDRLRCVVCNSCIEVCPVHCLTME